jgi:hypothetical protein
MCAKLDKSVIPHGMYCYTRLSSDSNHLTGKNIKRCPYWSIREDKPYQENGYCAYMKVGDWEDNGTSLLWDQVKECGVHPRQTAFISGHLDLTQEEFNKYYKYKIDIALKRGDDFVVGDAPGADDMAQQYLKDKTDCVYVYHMFDAPRYNVDFICIGGFQSDSERDESLTDDSDYDIAWVRPGREKSGTQNNIDRRNHE